MNLAINDVPVLAESIIAARRATRALDQYSPRCLARVWRAERFSWWMTSMLHRDERDDGFGRRLQLAQLEEVVGSRAAAQSLAENYVGAPPTA